MHNHRGGYRISGKGGQSTMHMRKIFGHAHKLINNAP